MKYFSMFSGIGGFEKGIQNVNKECHCVGFSEVDKYAKQIYKYHFGGRDDEGMCFEGEEQGKLGNARSEERQLCELSNTKQRPFTYNQHGGHKDYGDCTKINYGEVEDFDILVGGFPCQAFSIAGKRGGFDDTRGTLFFEIARCLREKRPRLCVLENVKGLLSHDKGNTFLTILATLDELGYDAEWQVLNSKDFGVPQNRERVFIIGHLRGKGGRAVFPISPRTTQDNQGQIANCLDANYHKGPSAGFGGKGRTMVGTLRTHKDGEGFRKVQSGICPTIPARAREDGSGQPCLDDGARIRRLTPIECERLQGFPDNWTAVGTEGKISDTQRYKCCGNAVTTNVISAIFEEILREGTNE